MNKVRSSLLLVAVLLTACGLTGQSSPKTVAPLPKLATAKALCGPDDQPETGYQGQTPLADMVSGRSQEPYFCGLKIIGHQDVMNRGANWQLARIGDCAYMASLKASLYGPNDPVNTREPSGVAVIDASNPADPKLVQILRSPGSIDAVETMHAWDAGDRKVLVAGAYSGGNARANYPATGVATADDTTQAVMDIFDATADCTQPKLMTTYVWPENAHDLTVNPKATRVYGTAPGSVMVLDIADMANPRLIGQFELTFPDGTPLGRCHTVTVNADETRLYCAGPLSAAATPDDEPAGSPFLGNGPSIWDISEISQGKPDPQVVFVGESDIGGQGGHHAVPAMINGKPHIVAANELALFADCDAGAFPRIWDISNEQEPKLVGEFRLEVQDHCDEPDVRAENAMGNYGSHYNNVDNYYENTRLGLFGMTGAGFRVVDLRDPSNPREVAYYKPGANPGTTLQNGQGHWTKLYYNDAVTDACGARAFVHPTTGHIWFGCQSNGFFIAELSPEARAYLDKPLGAGN